MSLGGDLIASVSSGRALCGTFVGGSNEKIGSKRALKQLLRPPDANELMAPDQACKKESLFYSNIQAGESHCEAVKNSGWSAAVKLSAQKETCSGRKTSEAYHMEYLYVPKKSFSIPRQQMRLSDEALADLVTVQTLENAEFFLGQYNSHVSTGRYHVGGVLMKSVKIVSKSKTSVKSLLDKFSRRSNSRAEVSYMTVKGSMDVTLASKANVATAIATYTAIGPQTDDEDKFMAGLEDKSTWAIIDTSDEAELVPVWEIASSVHPKSCALLRLAWQRSIESLASPEITGRLKELRDQSYQRPFPSGALGDSITQSEISSPAECEEASAPAWCEEASPPVECEEASPPAECEEASAPAWCEEASPPVECEEASPPAECEEAIVPFFECEEASPPAKCDEEPIGGGELDESGEAAPFHNSFENHSTFVGDGAIHDTSSKPIKSQLPLMKAENLGFDAALRSTATMYHGIQAVDSGSADKASTEHKSDRCEMDGFQVRNEIHDFQENQLVSSEAGSCVYRLMQIKLDKQDLSFVEKVTLLQGEIHNLCNRIVPNSVRNLGHDKYRLSFSQLNNSALQVLGYYGNKTVMMDVFRTKHIVDRDTLQLMEKGELQPGLYASLRDETMHVFYWHDQGHGRNLSVASRKDISCNFIRYLVELCDVVHICLESDGLRPLLTASKSTLGKKKRTQRLKISVVKASENDLKFLSGWEKELPLNGLADPVDIMLTEGYSRAALLVATPRPPRMSLKKDSTTVSVKDVPTLVASWQTNHNVDARDLVDKDFVVLLEYAQLEGYEGLCNLKETWKKKQAEQTEMEYKIDDLVAEEQMQVLGIFERGVSSYLKEHFPWEEGLLSDGSRASMNSPSDELQLQEVGLERAICEFWAGAHGGPDKELIFCGSEISFISLNSGHEKADVKYSVQVSKKDNPGFKRFGPLMYGEEYSLKRIEMSGESRVTTFKFIARDGVCCVGPVLTGQPLSVKYGSKKSDKIGGVKVHKRPCSDPVDRWMQSLAAFPSLLHKASLIECGLTQLRNRAAEENIIIDQDEKALINAMLTGSFNAVNQSNRFLESEWVNLLVKDSPVQVSSSVSPAVEAECVEIHQRNRDELTGKVCDMVKKNIYPLLKDKIKMDLKLQKKELEEQGSMEEVKYIRSIRQVFDSQFKKDLPTLSIRSCEKSQSWIPPWTEQLTVDYSTEVQEMEDLTWNVIELALLKKDLETLHTNANHVLIPNLHQQVHLMDLDSKQSRLSKVVYLKSGSVLVFVEQYVGDPLLSIFLCPKLGADMSRANPKKILKKRVDLVAFDEGTRFLALYVKSTTSTSIDILFFDDTYSHLEFTGIHTNLKEYNTDSRSDIVWMRFVPGKPELVLIDSLNCARLLELTQTPMFRARHIHIPFAFTKGCISTDGSCLIVLHTQDGSETELNTEQVSAQDDMCHTEIASLVEDQQPPRDDEPQMLTFEVYWLETMTHLKSQGTSKISVCNVTTVEATVVTFGTQMHLLIHDRANPSLLYSTVLESSSASEVWEMQVQGSSNLGPTQNASCDQRSCPELDFVYHIFDKYATSPPLTTEPGHQTERGVAFDILLKGSESDLGVKCENYVKEGLEKLKAEKAKDFSGLAVTLQSQSLETWLRCSDVQVHGKLVPAGSWIQLLMCLVPIQIARAENNGLKPLVDGLQIPSHLNYSDALSLARIIQFGFYETILEGWVGDIKVISSMGKQSSGKSYLLNHLSGSLLDVAGGRCTDGVWLTVRTTKDCLYILLDFEGLGSFERSEQEDMLLSIFNAAVSNITIFNKKDFQLDKETEAVFEKFQSGVSLVKQDSKLFQGLFYIAIKDVDTSDVEDLKMEFQEKILQICRKSKQNFLTSMYGGEVEIAAMPPFQRLEYHDSIKEIASTVRELVPSHHNGLSFMRDLKLVLAQISAKDWSPIDSKRVAFKLCFLRKHWESAISLGCLGADESSATLINFDTGEPISELISVQVGPHETFDYDDTGVRLAPTDLDEAIETVLDPLRTIFQGRYPRNSEHDEAWHSSFESFLAALAERRKERVLEWIRVNTLDFEKDGDVQKLRLEALALLASLQQRLTLCSCKCPRCFLRCIQERSHPGDHSCRTDHKCTQSCTYCADDGIPTSGAVSKCSDSAGHQGPHDCQEKAHTCGMDCLYLDQAANCNRVCTGKTKHTGDHKCNSRQHMCRSTCSLPSCRNPCVIPFEHGDHDLHACHEKQCLEKCTMQGCNRNCASKDHFHSQAPGERHHFCGDEHSCPEKCDAQGICEILTEVVKKTRTFQGIRATFEYEHVSEQNGMRKACCIPIPPYEEVHQGPHLHTANKNAVHFCETRCHACGYFCNLPIGHTGSHSTNHGNMKDVNFVSESEEIDIMDRKYSWGESGLAEMCMMHCKNQGRGHIHLIPCLAHGGGVCAAMVIEGARHETCKYGPDVDIPKDELTHAAFWKHMRFKDPCSEDDGRMFALCNHQCRSSEHKVTATGSQQASYCVEPLWHTAVSKVAGQGAAGYITDDGHHFACDHSKDVESHVLFVIDRSVSMGMADCVPTMAKFTALHRNRLGCVYESTLRFIRARQARIIQDYVSVVLFDSTSSTAIDSNPIAETLVDLLLPYVASGGTTYSSGIRAAEEILVRSATNPVMQKKSPVVIFLSDGGNNGGENPVNLVKRMKQVEPKLIFHTIKFGRDTNNQILMDMASAGSGSFHISLDEVQLARSFEGLARSLKDKVSSLM